MPSTGRPNTYELIPSGMRWLTTVELPDESPSETDRRDHRYEEESIAVLAPDTSRWYVSTRQSVISKTYRSQPMSADGSLPVSVAARQILGRRYDDTAYVEMPERDVMRYRHEWRFL
jgi:hypothetical protein